MQERIYDLFSDKLLCLGRIITRLRQCDHSEFVILAARDALATTTVS